MVDPEAGLQNAPCRGPSPAAVAADVQAVRAPLFVSMLKIRIKSAPRSGASKYFPVGSVIVECGCGASCLDGLGPFWDMVKDSFCKSCELDDKGSLYVEILDWPLEICISRLRKDCCGYHELTIQPWR